MLVGNQSATIIHSTSLL